MRDYALSSEDARRASRTGWRRLVAVFGSTRDAFSRPLAIGLTTIGLAGLLVTTVPGALPGASSSAACPRWVRRPAAPVPAPIRDALGGEGRPPAPAASAAASEPGPGTAALAAPRSGRVPRPPLPGRAEHGPLPVRRRCSTRCHGSCGFRGRGRDRPCARRQRPARGGRRADLGGVGRPGSAPPVDRAADRSWPASCSPLASGCSSFAGPAAASDTRRSAPASGPNRSRRSGPPLHLETCPPNA